MPRHDRFISRFVGRHVGRHVNRATPLLLCAALAGGCATRSGQVQPLPSSQAEFLTWDCARIDDETDLVQQRAVDVAYAVDERAGNNIIALGVGLAVFWPAMLAMRPDGLEAADLARLKGRYEALRSAARGQGCPPPAPDLSAERAAGLPLALGERLVFEERSLPRGPAVESVLRVNALRRGELEYEGVTQALAPAQSTAAPPTPAKPAKPAKPATPAASAPRQPGRRQPAATAVSALHGTWRQDRAGNITSAPAGALQWPHLLRSDLVLGAVTAGDIVVAGDPLARARMRGQVVAVGPQSVAGRLFDVAVVELFGDAPADNAGSPASTRVDGAIVVDRISGVLLRLDLRSGNSNFALQRRLVRVEPAVVR